MRRNLNLNLRPALRLIETGATSIILCVTLNEFADPVSANQADLNSLKIEVASWSIFFLLFLDSLEMKVTILLKVARCSSVAGFPVTVERPSERSEEEANRRRRDR